MSASHFRELDVWQAAMELAKAVYRMTAEFPAEERYGLTRQLQRAAVSIPSNIAEGNARQSTAEYARFVSFASGSLAELITQLQLAAELGLAKENQAEPVQELAESVGRMLYRPHQALRGRIKSRSPVPGPRSPVPGPQSPVPDPRSPVPDPRSPVPDPRSPSPASAEGV